MSKLTDNFGEQMHLMGQIQVLLTLEILIQKDRQKLEKRLAKLKEPTPRKVKP